MTYDRDYLLYALPAARVENCGDYAESTDLTAVEFCARFNQVLDYLRANVPFCGTEDGVMDAIEDAKSAWADFCCNQGDYEATIQHLMDRWVWNVGDRVLVETMPDHLRASHRAANNWGLWPANGAERRWVGPELADHIVRNDPDGYARVVWRTAP